MSENKVSVIIESLKADILDGKYAPGSAFPSVKMICRRCGKGISAQKRGKWREK